MDFNMKQWRNEQKNESSSEEVKNTAKLPRLVLDLDSSYFSSCYPHSSSATTGFSVSCSDNTDTSVLPLFVSEPPTNNKLSAFTLSPDSTVLTATKLPRMESSYFSLAQWQELELQALVYKHMLAGAPVPNELLHLIKKSLINSSPYYNLPQQYHHYQQALLQSGYWGRTNMDPEPGRCRRTDGKKWRCSRDVVSGHKYCERHVHRGRNRSRKPVETTTTAAPRVGNAAASNRGSGEALRVNPAMVNQGGVAPQFTLSGHAASTDLLHLNQRPMEGQNDGGSNGQILLHFFDDWPRQQLEENDNAGSMASATSLSISIPGNPSSDVSLKLSTGDRYNSDVRVSNVERSTWGTNHVASMGGGPLAEALRSSMSNSSPTSVLHHLTRGNTSDASCVST
ncbi:growth-regulating factor 3 [Capsicum annuum]|uniref:growth-regulating factor 3 n=1 Tax=Capsicum annuum TaxID=4072 RepID=UPI001FB0778E|nr:growth-regulating factor 3 [Capsicum annuum]